MNKPEEQVEVDPIKKQEEALKKQIEEASKGFINDDFYREIS